jgi:hypothetical protein
MHTRHATPASAAPILSYGWIENIQSSGLLFLSVRIFISLAHNMWLLVVLALSGVQAAIEILPYNPVATPDAGVFSLHPCVNRGSQSGHNNNQPLT